MESDKHQFDKSKGEELWQQNDKGWNPLNRNPNGFMTDQIDLRNGLSYHDITTPLMSIQMVTSRSPIPPLILTTSRLKSILMAT
ncbi:MAG: hypothetical protein HQK65_18895 [Desulfamplus sp.]|nr:hypothetical protein [Desulfamplus sp.]